MNNNGGWVKLHRKLWDNPIVTKDAEHIAVWVYLLTHASHNKYPIYFGNKKINLKPGQLIAGRKAIAEATGINESKVKRILKIFKSDQQIDQLSSRQGSLITILNWHKYQISDQKSGHKVATKWPQSDHYQEDKEDKESSSRKKITVKNNPKWLSDALTQAEWKRIFTTYENAIDLIDYVDSQIMDATEVKKPFKYIMAIAEKKNWPRK